MEREALRQIVKETLESFFDSSIPIGISNRHIHLCQSDYDALFPHVDIAKKVDLKQPGEFATEQTVNIIGPKGTLSKVRLLGPLRSHSQLEISLTDGRQIGVTPPIAMSGDLSRAIPVTIQSPYGQITRSICIAAKRHIHMSPFDALRFGVANGDRVNIAVQGEDRHTVFQDVIIRVGHGYALEMHVDTDEANAAHITPHTVGRLVP